MSRAVRTTVGSVVAGVLAFVALVSGVMAAVGSGGGGDPFALLDAGVDTPATAEVLDVDEDDDWPTVDVRWTTPDGEVVVTYVDWEWGELPEVGDEVEVLYDAAAPEFAFAADDPYVSDVRAGAGSSTDPGSAAGSDEVLDKDEAAPGAGDDLSRIAGWVSLAALLSLVVTAVVTIVAAVRAPAAPTPAQVPSGFDVLPPLPHQSYPGYSNQHAYPAQPQPYPAQPYPARPQPPQPRPPQQGSWPHPG